MVAPTIRGRQNAFEVLVQPKPVVSEIATPLYQFRLPGGLIRSALSDRLDRRRHRVLWQRAALMLRRPSHKISVLSHATSSIAIDPHKASMRLG